METQCFWCSEVFYYEDEEVLTFEDIRWIDDENIGPVLVEYVNCPHCGENTEI